MNDLDASSPLDRAIETKRRVLVHQINHAQIVQRHFADLERKWREELEDLETARRVMRELPVTDEAAASMIEKMNFLTSEEGTNQLIAAAVHTERERVVHATRLRMTEEMRERELLMATRQYKPLVTEFSMSLLRDGSWKSTEQIHEELTKRGIKLPVANPMQRISQILSADDRFVTQRGRGWSLRDQPTAAENQASDELDAKLRREARRVVNDDRRGR